MMPAPMATLVSVHTFTLEPSWTLGTTIGSTSQAGSGASAPGQDRFAVLRLCSGISDLGHPRSRPPAAHAPHIQLLPLTF